MAFGSEQFQAWGVFYQPAGRPNHRKFRISAPTFFLPCWTSCVLPIPFPVRNSPKISRNSAFSARLRQVADVPVEATGQSLWDSSVFVAVREFLCPAAEVTVFW